MIKCKRFWKVTEYNSSCGGTIIISPNSQFNDWITEDIKIFSVQALGDSNGSCQEIVVFYEEVSTK